MTIIGTVTARDEAVSAIELGDALDFATHNDILN
jgi:hypothetical protein